MFFTACSRPQIAPPRPSRLLAAALLLAVPGFAWHPGRATAATTVPWHPDLPAAQRASLMTGKPVLAIFTASWMPMAAAIDRTALASDEAVAVVTAFYEPVCVDVDADAEATKRAGVARVPTACVLNADNRVLARFEMPETPAAFVAAAARAAQDAAVATTNAQATVATADRSPAALTRLPGSGSPFGSPDEAASWPTRAAQERGLVPPGDHAITAVAAKVRMLSDFAGDDAPSTGGSDAIAASFHDAWLPQPAAAPSSARATPPAAAAPSLDATAAASQPAPRANPAPATGTVTSAPTESLAGTVSPGPLGIDPAATAPQTSQAATPWLGMPQAAPAIAPATAAQPTPPPAAVASAPARTAVAIEPHPSTTQSSTTQAASDQAASDKAGTATTSSSPTQAPSSTASSLLATLQKPFGMFTKPTVPEPRQEAAPAAQPAPAPAEPDAYGSMPVGLEGYCPVMLAERGIWVEGRAQWGARHRGRTYLFAGEQQQKAFLQDPDRYAPALSGDDPVLVFDGGKSTPGQRRYGVTYQSRMYLFSSSETRDAFAANPQRYTAGTFVAEGRGSANGSAIR